MNRGWAATGSVGVIGVVMLMLAARNWIASMFSDIGPARAADVVLFALLGACAGVLLLMFAFVGVLLVVRTREPKFTPSASQAVIEAEPSPDWRLISNGINSRQLLPRSQLLDLAGRAVRDLRPHTAPTQANLCSVLGVGGGTASAIQTVLREWDLADVRDGVPSAWK